eukprot:3586970-Prymnesium_polylepis.1
MRRLPAVLRTRGSDAVARHVVGAPAAGVPGGARRAGGGAGTGTRQGLRRDGVLLRRVHDRARGVGRVRVVERVEGSHR